MKKAIAAGLNVSTNDIYKLTIKAARRLGEIAAQIEEDFRRLNTLTSYDIAYSVIVPSTGDKTANQNALVSKIKDLSSSATAQKAMKDSLTATEGTMTFGTITEKTAPLVISDVVVVRNTDGSIVAPPTGAAPTAAPPTNTGTASGSEMLGPSFAAYSMGLLMWLMKFA